MAQLANSHWPLALYNNVNAKLLKPHVPAPLAFFKQHAPEEFEKAQEANQKSL